jgi:outer membrane protein OmpA-like peptidoglycan-associated protein
MSIARNSASTLHLQMGQEVMYLLLVTSLVANFILATLALRASKADGVLNSTRNYTEITRENRQLRASQAQLQDQVTNLKFRLDSETSERKKAEIRASLADARIVQADARLKEAQAGKTRPAAPQDQPPIINLREAEGFKFESGSSDISPEFLEKLRSNIVPRLAQLSERYGAQIVEVIGHTDGTSIRDTSRVKANLDDSLSHLLESANTTSFLPYDNAGLGISRAVSVARALRATGLSSNLDIQPLSAAYLISPKDRAEPAERRVSDAERRRIEIRLRRISAN